MISVGGGASTTGSAPAGAGSTTRARAPRGVVVYDLGRTRCRAALVEDGRRVAEAVEPTTATVVDRDGEAAVARVLQGLAARLHAPRVAGAALGAAGMRQGSPAADRIAALLRVLHGPIRCVVASDATMAHAGALDGRAGVVLLAGTGAVALGVSSCGRHVQVDGWGYLLGDAGSAFAIGRSALAAALSSHDGRGPRTVLVELAGEHLGPLDDLPARVHAAANPARLVAGFAPAAAAAARSGDEVARRIWSDAAANLARTAAAAVARLRALGGDTSEVLLSWAGGLFGSADLLLGPLEDGLRRLAPEAVLTPPHGDALQGAALLAHGAQTCHEPLLHLRAEEGQARASR